MKCEVVEWDVDGEEYYIEWQFCQVMCQEGQVGSVVG